MSDPSEQTEPQNEPQNDKQDTEKSKSEKEEYPKPSNGKYLSYYIRQEDWKPTRPRCPIGAMFSSPGPAIVNLPSTIGEKHHDFTRNKAPGYKMGIKLPKKSTGFGPGPDGYNLPDVWKKEQSQAPKFAQANRFRDRKSVESPGPAAYNREAGDKYIFPRAPGYSMPSSQRSKMKIAGTPGPNSYSLPSSFGKDAPRFAKGPAYSIGKSKREGFDVKPQSPGPIYMLPSDDIHIRRAPAFYMGCKLTPPGVSSLSPGPAAYRAHETKIDKYSTARSTFGIRHSPFKVVPGFDYDK